MTSPCGTPLRIFRGSDNVLLMSTLFDLSFKKSFNQNYHQNHNESKFLIIYCVTQSQKLF